MSQFYAPDARSAKTCRKSQLRRYTISISGLDKSDGLVKSYTGIVRSVVEDESALLPRRWLITMIDAP
jgi:hypothetical protein